MMLNTHGATQWRKDKSEEIKSQDYTVNTDTCVQGVHKLTVSLTLLTE